MPVQDYWGFFADDARQRGAPLYVRLAEAIGGDRELRALAQSAKPGQPPANLILGAVHFLLLRGADHPLRAFYPTLNPGGAAGDPFPPFRDFVMRYRSAVAELVATRITNTNEIGRSAILHPGFRVLAEETGRPLYLVEIGPSAGLNLNWDSYGVAYVRDGQRFETEAPDAPLVIEAGLRGAGVPPLGAPPEVAGRVGLELNPVDLGDADARDWLRALVWPDHVARLARLEKALAIAAGRTPPIRAGDALALLPEALAEAPKDAALCVYHTVVTYQFSREMREALENLLTAASLRRPVHRLSFEWAGDNFYPLRLARHHDGAKAERTLALCDPHGAWLEWQA